VRLLSPAPNDVSHSKALQAHRDDYENIKDLGFLTGNFCDLCKYKKILPCIEVAETMVFCSLSCSPISVNSSCDRWESQQLKDVLKQYSLLNPSQLKYYYAKYLNSTPPR
jgi:hypothetical protein